MEGVFTRQVCTAGSAYDMVGLKLGPCQFLMYYHLAFEIAASILQASKLAARFEGLHPTTWTEMIKVNGVEPKPLEPLHPTYRRTQAKPNFENWRVAFDRNLVVLQFDDEIIRMHFADAYTIYTELRLAGKNAKRWAGDRGKQWTTRATLADAEENDKFVYVA